MQNASKDLVDARVKYSHADATRGDADLRAERTWRMFLGGNEIFGSSRER